MITKTFRALCPFMFFFAACNTPAKPTAAEKIEKPVPATPEKSATPVSVGGDRDTHGCIGSAGYEWSVLKNECIRAFELKLRFNNLKNRTQAGYLFVSNDKKKAEFFGVEGTTSVLFDFKASKDNYYESTDGQYHLNEISENRWQLIKKGEDPGKIFESQ